MAGVDPWKNRSAVRICAAIDMLFPCCVMGMYLYRLMHERTPDGKSTINGFFTPKEKQGVAVFLWCSAFVINILQFVITYFLFTSVKASSRDADVSIRTSRMWLIFSNVLFVLLLSEIIFFLFFDKGYYGSRKTISTIICAAELFFKPVGMYFTKDFIDDLKTVYSAPPTKVQFMSLFRSNNKTNQTQSNSNV